MLKSVPWRRNNCDINTKPAASWLCLLKKQKQILSNVIFTSGRVKKKKDTTNSKQCEVSLWCTFELAREQHCKVGC